MAKTNRKESRKIYEGYKKRQRLWNTIFIVFFAVIGIGSAVLNGTMELDPQIVIGKYEFTWFHLVILAVLGFGIVALKRDSSEEQQEIYRQEREEAIRLRQEVMAERKQEMQDAYNAMKRRRAERLAAQGMAPTAAQAEATPMPTLEPTATPEPTEKPTPDPEQVQRQEQAAQTSSKLPLYVAVGIAVVCAGIVAAVLISRQLQNTQAQTQKQKDEKSAYHRKKGGK